MTEQIEIARQEFRHGERLFVPGERVNLDHYLKNHTMNERDVGRLREHKYVVPLTRENYAHATTRQGDRVVAKGFHEAELVEMGILPPAGAAPAPAAFRPAPVAATPHPAAAANPPDLLPPTAESIAYEGYTITPRKRGNTGFPPTYYVTNSAGVPQRPAGFRSVEGAKLFIDTRAAADLAQAPAADSPAVEQEAGDDGDIRSGAG